MSKEEIKQQSNMRLRIAQKNKLPCWIEMMPLEIVAVSFGTRKRQKMYGDRELKKQLCIADATFEVALEVFKRPTREEVRLVANIASTIFHKCNRWKEGAASAGYRKHIINKVQKTINSLVYIDDESTRSKQLLKVEDEPNSIDSLRRKDVKIAAKRKYLLGRLERACSDWKDTGDELSVIYTMKLLQEHIDEHNPFTPCKFDHGIGRKIHRADVHADICRCGEMYIPQRVGKKKSLN